MSELHEAVVQAMLDAAEKGDKATVEAIAALTPEELEGLAKEEESLARVGKTATGGVCYRRRL